MNTDIPDNYGSVERVDRAEASELSAAVMARVRTICFIRAMLTPELVKAVVLVASVASVAVMIHIGQIVDNMSELPGVSSYPAYIYGAFLHTSFAVQAIVILAAAAGAWLTVDGARRAGASAYGFVLNARRAAA